MQLTRYEQTAAPQLCALLNGDRYSFSVRRNILGGVFGPVSKIITDHARLILCYTCPPFPGWVWLPADADEQEIARAWALIRRELPYEQGYRVNMRVEMAQSILRMPGAEGLHVQMQIDAYACAALVPPDALAQGDYRAVGMEFLDEAAAWLYAMKQETGLDPMPLDSCRAEMQDFIARKRLFVWRLEDGETVAMCAVTEEDGMGYLGHVYTPVQHRRRGYAQSLVHHVTRAMLAQGMEPALCVLSSNEPAAACYRKLGYALQGSFCTVGSKA